MSTLHPVSTQVAGSHNEQLAQLCKASADKLRLDILKVLSRDSYSVQELCQVFALKQSSMSHHLKVLAAAELVTTRREGNTIFYRRRIFPHSHPFVDWQKALFQSIDVSAFDDEVAHQMANVETQRTTSSTEFFLENAAKFREQQDLIASFEQYADSVAGFIGTIALPSRSKVVEIGPGDGRFLALLAPMFKQVLAFDNSPAMYDSASAFAANQGLDNVALTLGDTRLARQQVDDADCVIVNMVLHHIASPADVFADIAQCLRPGGALVITDLCHHDQSWARESCGDLWLGFEPEDLSLWAAAAGLEEGQATYLAQRNGFRIQIRHFYRSNIEETSA